MPLRNAHELQNYHLVFCVGIGRRHPVVLRYDRSKQDFMPTGVSDIRIE